MQHDLLTSRRAAVYQWFSQLLFQELSETQLQALGEKESQNWIASLAAIPSLAADAIRLESSLEQVLQRADRQLELAADYAEIFLLAPPGGVSPYAGHYPHTTPSLERMQMNAMLVEYKLAPRENEASDHIAVQLALMAEQIAGDVSPGTQYYFLHHHIMIWAPLFMTACQQRAGAGFYAAAVTLLVHFMQEDEAYLESLLMDDFYRRRQD